MNEGTFRVKEIELVVETAPCRGDGSSVGQHAQAARDLGQVAGGDVCGGLVADTQLEASGAPVNKLDGTLGLNNCNGGVDILGDDITAVQESAGHCVVD